MDSAPGTRVVQGETSERFKGLTFEGLVGAGRRFVPLLSSSSPSSAILPSLTSPLFVGGGGNNS